jgi:hypothetical protein
MSRPGLTPVAKNGLERNASAECERFRESERLFHGQVSPRKLAMKQVVEGRFLNALPLRGGQLSKSRLPVFQWRQVQRDPVRT